MNLLALWFSLLAQMFPFPGNPSIVTATPTPLVTSVTIGTLRNNFSGCVGTSMTLLSSVTVTDLGRWVVSGNSGTHTVYVSDGATILATASVNTSGVTANTFAYTAITPVVLAAGNYLLLSQETSGGDQWGDNDTTITTAAVWNQVQGQAIVSVSCNATALGNNFFPQTYVPPNFKYY